MDFVNKYANLINTTLLISIIGLIIHITKSHVAVVQEKYESKIAQKESEISALNERLISANDTILSAEKLADQRLAMTKDDLINTEKWYEREVKRLQNELSILLKQKGLSQDNIFESINSSKVVTEELRNTIKSVLHEISELENSRYYLNSNPVINQEFILEQANAYAVSNQWLEAAHAYGQYLQSNSGDWKIHFLRGVAFANARNGEYTDIAAARSYNEAILLKPENIQNNTKARLYTYRGAISKRLNQLEEAEAFLILAEKLASERYEIYDTKYNLAAVYSMQGKEKEMLDYLNELVGQPEMLNVITHINDYFLNYKNNDEFISVISK